MTKGNNTRKAKPPDKLSHLDSLQGLFRNQAYREDCEYLYQPRTLEETCDTLRPEEETIVEIPVQPRRQRRIVHNTFTHIQFRDGRLKAIQRKMKKFNLLTPIPPRHLPKMIQDAEKIRDKKTPFTPPATLMPCHINPGKGYRSRVEEWEYLVDGKFICLKIDITATKKDLEASVWSQVQSYRDLIRYDPLKSQTSDYDPRIWEIYDRVYQEGQKTGNVFALAKDDLGVTHAHDPDLRNPAFNQDLDNLRNRYKVHLKKAEAMVQQVYPSR